VFERIRERTLAIWDQGLDWLLRRWSHALIPVSLALCSAFLVENPLRTELPHLKIGDIASGDVKAPNRLSIIDEDLTRARQIAAEQDVPPVFDFDSQSQSTTLARVRSAFEAARKGNESEATLESLLRIDLERAEWVALKQGQFSPAIESALNLILENILRHHLLVHEDFQLQSSGKLFILRDLFSEIEETMGRERFEEKILSPEMLQERLSSLIQSNHRTLNQIPRSTKLQLASIASKLLSPNTSFNQIETTNRKKEIQSRVERVQVDIEKGEMIIREGQKVDRSHLILLEGIRSQSRQVVKWSQYFGLAALLFCLVFIFHWVGARNFKKFRMSTRDRIVLGSYFVLSLGLITSLNFLTSAAESHNDSGISLTPLIPFAFVGMTLRLFTSMEITAFFAILLGLCVGWLMQDPYISLVFIAVSFAGAAAMRHINQRMDVVKAGLFAGAVQCSLILLGAILGLVPSVGFENSWVDLLMTAAFAMASGLLSASIVLVSQPLIEFLGYTTDLRLMELSNTNHPLLKELIMKAPGSYYHSFVVSQLSEKAAEAINANPLFARVASLYHDVGKLTKPLYFIENIQGENKHDKLVPTMSALIIANHVKEGIDLAQRYQVPQSIIEVIPQHHGTALISYFYDKAKKAAGSEAEVDEKDFRYPGPKPQTKEAAIIMCADAVEATVKSLGNMSVDQLRQKVNATIRRFFLDGQLDECELSLKDLNRIGNAFVNVLQGIYHQRIEYPHLQEQEKHSEAQEPQTKSITSKSLHS
jgi:putative nucleotidyltransferase with HDIG domain